MFATQWISLIIIGILFTRCVADFSKLKQSALLHKPIAQTNRAPKSFLQRHNENSVGYVKRSDNKVLLKLSVFLISLTKSMVGIGALSFAKAADDVGGNVAIPALLCLWSGAVTAYSFYSLGYVCNETNASSMYDLLGKCGYSQPLFRNTFSFMLSAKCFLSCVCCSLVIEDSIVSLYQFLRHLEWYSSIVSTNPFSKWLFQLPRMNVVKVVTGLMLLPLCYITNFSSIVPLTFFGLVGSLYTAAFMVYRLLDGTYIATPPMISLADVAAQIRKMFCVPKSESVKTLYTSFLHSLNQGTLKAYSSYALFLSTLSVGYLSHHNAPQFFKELKDSLESKDLSCSDAQPSYRNNSLWLFRSGVVASFSLSTFIYLTWMLAGVATFGSSALSGAGAGISPLGGNVLTSYRQDDVLAMIARFCSLLSMMTLFPFSFAPLFSTVLGTVTAMFPNVDGQTARTILIPALMLLVSFMSVFLRNIHVLSTFVGATFGNFVIYILPGILNLSLMKLRNESADQSNEESGQFDKGKPFFDKIDRLGSVGLVAYGALSTCLGVISLLYNAYAPAYS